MIVIVILKIIDGSITPTLYSEPLLACHIVQLSGMQLLVPHGVPGLSHRLKELGDKPGVETSDAALLQSALRQGTIP